MFIRIETTSGVPITRQIMDQIRMQIATGALPPGERLPSVRALGRELAVNQNTILRVYERLTAEGMLEMRHGDGTYVAKSQSPGQLKLQHDRLRQEADRLVRQAAALGLTASDLHELLESAFQRIDHRSLDRKGTDHG